jgi:hypothetical protein
LPEIVELVERAQYSRYTLDADEQRRLQMAGEQVWVRLAATSVLRADG